MRGVAGLLLGYDKKDKLDNYLKIFEFSHILDSKVSNTSTILPKSEPFYFPNTNQLSAFLHSHSNHPPLNNLSLSFNKLLKVSVSLTINRIYFNSISNSNEFICRLQSMGRNTYRTHVGGKKVEQISANFL